MHRVVSRKDVLPERIWSVEDILNEDNLPKLFDEISAGAEEIARYKKTLTPNNAIECLLKRSEISYKIEKAYVYIHLKSDEDKGNAKYLDLCDRIDFVGVQFATACSFIEPTLAGFRTKDLIAMKNNEKYSYFSMYLDALIRQKRHLLSEKEEVLLSATGLFSDEFHTAFSAFDNVDVSWGEMTVDGETIPLSHGSISVLLQHKDRAVRKEAYEKLYAGYKKMINTIAAIYAGSVKKDCFYAKARKYEDCLHKALYLENIPTRVYDNLLEVVTAHTKTMHSYVKYRKTALRLKEMRMYDMYVPLTDYVKEGIEYDEAFETVTKALEPMGEEYVSVLKQAKKDRWIDVEETERKRSGAYSWAVYGTHPYVLLNHKGTIHDVFTIAHEMGHAMHSYYSNRAQCYEKAEYCIFLAEIASTVNEVLLIKYLLKDAKGEVRKYLLTHYADMFRTTLFRQTMFAEFEKYAHETAEKGEALGAEKLSAYYAELNRKYYGDAVVTDDDIATEWARIPHFYRAFYVYKYATGLTCAVNIANSILAEEGFVEKYKTFLSSGSSKYPMEILAGVDVDLTKKKPFIVAMNEFRQIVTELKKREL